MSMLGKFASISLKTKITATVLLLFLCSIWVLTFFISKRLEQDMTAQIEAQQFSTASYIADSIENQIKLRIHSLTTIASLITPELVANPTGLREFLSQKPLLSTLFQTGVAVISKEGKGIADYPPLPGRSSASYTDKEYYSDVVATGKPAVGKPQIGRFSQQPIIGFAVPVFAGSSRLIGVIAGFTLLSDPTLLGTVENTAHKDFPDRFLVMSSKYRVYITGSDPTRIMKATPEPGVNPLFDKFTSGFEGSGITVNSRGIEMLQSAKQIPTPGWFIRVGMPAEMAFAAIDEMKIRVYSIALGLSMLSSLLVWFVVRQALRPLHTASKLIKDITEERLPLQTIPVTQDDEVGQLLSSFNVHLNYRKEAEEELNEKEQKYRLLFESANDGIFIQDETGFIDCNQKGAEMYGLAKEKIIGRPPREFAPERQPDGRLSSEVADEKIQAALSGVPQIFEWQPMHADGSQFDVEITLSRLELGGKMYLQAIVRDITERKRAADRIKLRESYLTAIIENQPGLVWLKDEKSFFLAVNRAFALSCGRKSSEELVGKTDLDIWPKELAETYRADDAHVMNERKSFNVEEPIYDKGNTKWFETFKTPVFDETGRVIGTTGYARDITARKQADEALKASEIRFRSLIENASSGILVADIETRKFIYANPMSCHMLGYSKEELLTLEVASIHPSSELARVDASFKKHTLVQTLCLRRDGTVFPVEIRPMELELDGRRCLAGVLTDITEKQLLEEERLKTGKLESIGTLAGGIAHDFNNLLQGIFGYISMAKMTMDNKEKMLAMLTQAELALHQSVNLTTQLLTFSKGGKPIKKLVNLGTIIENFAKFTLSGSRSDLHMDIAPDLWKVEADEGQIGQVIQNIVMNADQAMPMGGSVLITAHNVFKDDASLPLGLAIGRYVRVTIQDMGIGIPKQYIAKIFDPYFTTKEKGSGLGLATSYAIVRNHGGLIDVKSTSGKGTLFLVYLPAGASENEITETPVISTTCRKGKILVMDDDALIRDIAREFIMALGHQVDLSENGETAIAKYRSAMESGKPFDIVILDLTVRGGMSGRETIERLLVIDPEVIAIVSSGYSDDTVIADYQKYQFKARLPKPYRLDDLRDTLNELLK